MLEPAEPRGHLANPLVNPTINCDPWGGPGFESHEDELSDLELAKVGWSGTKSGADRTLGITYKVKSQ